MPADDVSSDSIQVVLFNLLSSNGKKENYAMPIEQVREIRTVERITKVPRSEPHVLGIMNLRGLIIPVIDIKKKLKLDSQKTQGTKQRILVADLSGSLMGLLVDEVDQVIRISEKDLETPPQGTFDSYHYIKAIAKVDEKLVLLLDVNSLLEQKKSDQRETTEKPRPTRPVAESQKEQGVEPKERAEPTIQSLDDLPVELAEVFKEDAEGIPPTQIIREN